MISVWTSAAARNTHEINECTNRAAYLPFDEAGGGVGGSAAIGAFEAALALRQFPGQLNGENDTEEFRKKNLDGF